MGGRDHSETCETCGLQRGGLNDLLCDCDDPYSLAGIPTHDGVPVGLHAFQGCESCDKLLAESEPADGGFAYTPDDEWEQMIAAHAFWTLGKNLANAGMLARSFELGVNAAASWLSGQLDGQNAWEPGCGWGPRP